MSGGNFKLLVRDAICSFIRKVPIASANERFMEEIPTDHCFHCNITIFGSWLNSELVIDFLADFGVLCF